MSTKFDDYIREIEEKVKAEGPQAVARWNAFNAELFPIAELPDEWKVGDDGSPAPNWVAALHRSRRDH